MQHTRMHTHTHTHAFIRTLSAYAVWGVWKTQICVGGGGKFNWRQATALANVPQMSLIWPLTLHLRGT